MEKESAVSQPGITVLSTDKPFTDSPDCGHPDCKCSRCGNVIPSNQSPILRVWPTRPEDPGYDSDAQGGTEFRYCWPCSKAMGVDFGEPINEEA
jgi:hypothetical protein